MNAQALFQFSPWWLMLTPLALFPPIYILRRFRWGGWLALGVHLSLAMLALLIPRSNDLTLLNRPLVYDELTAYMLALIFGITAGLTLLSFSIPQGWTFYPFSLIIVTLLTLAMLNQVPSVMALVLTLAALVTAFIIQGGRAGSVQAPLRFITMFILGVPPMFIAAQQLGVYRLNVNNAFYLGQIALWLGLSYALWLGIFPFHSWVSTLTTEASPGISVFVLVVFPVTILVNVVHLAGRYPELAQFSAIAPTLQLAGASTVLFGGFLAANQRAFGPLLGYTAIFDLGLSVMALSLPGTDGYRVVVLALMVRALGLTLLAISGAAIQAHAGSSAFEQVQGLAQQLPLASLGIGLGALTLAGMPLTLGFVPRWLLLQTLTQNGLGLLAGIVVLGGLGVALGYLRGLRALVTPEPRWLPKLEGPIRGTEPLILGLILLCVGLGVFPQTLLTLVTQIVQGLS